MGDLNATVLYTTSNYMSYGAGARGSVFTGTNANSYLDLGGSTYQHSSSRVLIGDKQGSLLALGENSAHNCLMTSGTVQN